MRRLVFGVLAQAWIFGCGGATEDPFGDGEGGQSAAGHSGTTSSGRDGSGGTSGGRGGRSSGGAIFGGAGTGATAGFGAHAGFGASAGSGARAGAGGVGASAGTGYAGSTTGGYGAVGAFAGTAGELGGGVGGTPFTAGAGGTVPWTAGSGGTAGGPHPSCPPSLPTNTSSFAAPARCIQNVTCDYHWQTHCLCVRQGVSCVQVDPMCGLVRTNELPADPAPPDADRVPVAPPSAILCMCSQGSWQCGL